MTPGKFAALVGVAGLVVGCGSPAVGAHAGCLELIWGDFDRPEWVPAWLVPDRVRLDTTAVDERGWALLPGAAPAVSRARGDQPPWYEILGRRSWVPHGSDGVELYMTDAGYNRWTITLTGRDGRYQGTAAFVTTVGGVEERAEAPVRAAVCEEGT